MKGISMMSRLVRCMVFLGLLYLTSCGTSELDNIENVKKTEKPKEKEETPKPSTKELTQVELRDKWMTTLDSAAYIVGRYVMRDVSPNSGSQLKREVLITQGIKENVNEGSVSCQVKVSFSSWGGWNAPLATSSAEMWAELTFYPLPKNKGKISFKAIRYNEWFVRVSSSYKRARYEEGVMLDY